MHVISSPLWDKTWIWPCLLARPSYPSEGSGACRAQGVVPSLLWSCACAPKRLNSCSDPDALLRWTFTCSPLQEMWLWSTIFSVNGRIVGASETKVTEKNQIMILQHTSIVHLKITHFTTCTHSRSSIQKLYSNDMLFSFLMRKWTMSYPPLTLHVENKSSRQESLMISDVIF